MNTDFSKLHRAFNPKCIVVVGDKGETDFSWLKTQSNFKGKLYSVQTNPDHIKRIEAQGYKNYTSLREVPGQIDLAIIAVPRAVSVRILEDCIAKGVAAAHFFTSGFSETGTEEGVRLEESLVDKAKKANFNLIGPNCMGIFNPKIGLRQHQGQYTDICGPVGFISQSGTHAGTFSLEAHFHGVDISKSVSFGNGTVLDSTEYLEYFGQDTDTEYIAMYLEGVRNPRLFLEALKKVASRKPVVIWKGGQTDSGVRAIGSHTGSLAISHAVWSAALRQYGVIGVDNLEELIDTLNGLIHLIPVYGDRVGVAGASGGQSVAVADSFVKVGLKVPRLTQRSYTRLKSFFDLVGGSYGNPIDAGSKNIGQLLRILEILEEDKNIDNLVLAMTPRIWTWGYGFKKTFVSAASEITKQSKKPLMAIIPRYSTAEDIRRTKLITDKLLEVGIPTFPTLERGARALRNVLDSNKIRKSFKES